MRARPSALRLALAGALWATGSAARADDYTAVSTRTSNDYARVQTMDRHYFPETYALGIGGDYSGSERDPAGEKVGFRDVMAAIAGPLADQAYVPTKDPNKTKLLIMVYWGETTGTGDYVPDQNFSLPAPPVSAEHVAAPVFGVPNAASPSGFLYAHDNADAGNIFNRGESDARNAAILGYDAGLPVPAGSEITALHITRDDLIEDVRHNRYFVVLMAYDFQMLWKEKKHKLVWEARFSVRQRDNDFEKLLPAMAKYASQYFGKDTFGLIRRPLPEGDVEVGIPRAVASIPEAGAPSAVSALIGGPTAAEAEAQKWTTSNVPAELARRIDAYKRDRAALMQDLASRLGDGKADDGSREAVDAFNTENSTRIAMLSRAAQGIRVDLAQLAASTAKPTGDQPVNSLLKQFNAEVREIDVTEPILTHP
jgi:hypothetical protein